MKSLKDYILESSSNKIAISFINQDNIEDFMYIREKGDNMTLKLYRSYRCYKYNTSIVLFKQRNFFRLT